MDTQNIINTKLILREILVKMNWPSQICNNCKHESYTLATKNVCPFCNTEYFIEKLLSKDANIKKLKAHKKKYKVKVTNQQIKNIILLKKL